MKKILFSMIAALTLTCTFVACSDDDEDESYSYSTTADQATAGTYTGTWTRTLDGESETFDGTVTLASTGTAGASTITFSCPGSSLDATSVANVWNSKRDFEFMNQTISAANGLGAAFAGRITEAGQLTAAFTLTQKVGRKAYDYQYQFIGNK